MIRTSHAAPDTIRPADWRADAPCKADPDAMYPGSHDADIEYAKSFCRACPSIERCLQWALDTREEHGVWGGLSEGERRRLRRKLARPLVAEDDAEPRPATLAEAWKARTRPLDGGHLGWSGTKNLYFRGVAYTPKRAAFLVSRRTRPYGQVLVTCGVDECIHPGHIADGQERALMHGSRPGYQRHLAAGETPCDACRQANTDADNRLRRTGTTKAAA